MTDQPPEDDAPKHAKVSRWAVFGSVVFAVLTFVCVAVVGIGLWAVLHKDSPLPDEWNPLKPLVVDADTTPLTQWKLRQALANPEQCVAVLAAAARITPRDPFEASENCHIRNRVDLSGVGGARIDPLETTCATALRMAMWERHGLQPAAQDIFGTSITVIRQLGSYNCRPIRTTQGTAQRWSTHATADAIDISGFDLADGRRIRLLQDWEGNGPEARFLRLARDSACTWFSTTLGPDYNALHADHFHLQVRGWGTCR